MAAWLNTWQPCKCFLETRPLLAQVEHLAAVQVLLRDKAAVDLGLDFVEEPKTMRSCLTAVYTHRWRARRLGQPLVPENRRRERQPPDRDAAGLLGGPRERRIPQLQRQQPRRHHPCKLAGVQQPQRHRGRGPDQPGVHVSAELFRPCSESVPQDLPDILAWYH